ncbi:DNA cytosine methyltransferase [Amycolatopsis sp. NPDC006125]|uniref:DNA cytosine methyltransferase n=1 Tax=Amycolatopsis sp. NPDC006125 TaxID=3156730 RepID=UPI0033B84254
MTTVGQVELNPFCRAILAHHFPEAEQHDDVRTTVAWWHSRPRPRVHLVVGGFPCQPVSTAGRRRGEADERWLWPAMADVIAGLRPDWVLWENVPGLRTRGLSTVLADLDRLGYRCRVGTLSACSVGAPHLRQRLFGLAHTYRLARTPPCPRQVQSHPSARQCVHRADRRGRAAREHWRTEPRVGRVADGIPARMDRLAALGNAVVPAAAEHLGRLILAHHHAIHARPEAA